MDKKDKALLQTEEVCTMTHALSDTLTTGELRTYFKNIHPLEVMEQWQEYLSCKSMKENPEGYMFSDFAREVVNGQHV
jgi:hypothetical protein